MEETKEEHELIEEMNAVGDRAVSTQQIPTVRAQSNINSMI